MTIRRSCLPTSLLSSREYDRISGKDGEPHSTPDRRGDYPGQAVSAMNFPRLSLTRRKFVLDANLSPHPARPSRLDGCSAINVPARRPVLLATVTAFALIALADLPEPKKPPTNEELAAITERGRSLAGYDAAAWHASDALQAKEIKPGSVIRYIARKTDRGWTVAFGRLDKDKFLIAYEATQGKEPDQFDIREFDPPKEDSGFFRSAAKAIDVALKEFIEHFEGQQRPYNVAVLPAEKGQSWVYLVPAPTKSNVWPLGGDVRYLMSADGTKIQAKRQLHKVIIENEPPKDRDQQVAGGIHTHVLDETPEDTDVFHVLSRKPSVPELISTEHFVFEVEPDGGIKYLGKADEVLKK